MRQHNAYQQDGQHDKDRIAFEWALQGIQRDIGILKDHFHVAHDMDDMLLMQCIEQLTVIYDRLPTTKAFHTHMEPLFV